MSLEPGSPVTSLRGVGPVLERSLAEAGVFNLADLLAVLPFRYEDRSATCPLGELAPADRPLTVSAAVVRARLRRGRRGGPSVLEVEVADEGGALMAVWFNQPYLFRTMRAGRAVWLFGTVRSRSRGTGLEMLSPELEFADGDETPSHMGGATPIYRRFGAVSPRRWRSLVAQALNSIRLEEDPLAGWFPSGWRPVNRREALFQLHCPESVPESATQEVPPLSHPAALLPGYRRLVLEELLALKVALAAEWQRRRRGKAPRVVITDEVRQLARGMLPFQLTGAQKKVVSEVIADLQCGYPMARLVQGDVGSGKTVVAAMAALAVLASGGQVAFLAPTEILARQHRRTLAGFLGPAGYATELLTGGMSGRLRAAVHSQLANRAAMLVVGTHALIQEKIAFPDLRLVIIDEQHRFGVAQRSALVGKGESPHLLVMTATPIPRSLSQVVYGDLDLSLLDELPPGRRAVRTVLRDPRSLPGLFEFLGREVASGGRVFWVEPGIDEDEGAGWQGVERRAEELRGVLQGVEVGVAHGRMPATQREKMLEAFAAGRLQVLCATTVVEVGLDVPEATVMVIEHAQRFGLAQLHQLRGRVGRGVRRGLCVALTSGDLEPAAKVRLESFAATNDGFRIAEQDLLLRGPGELTGVRQWGRPELRLTDFTRHQVEIDAAEAIVREAVVSGRLDDLAQALERIHPGRWALRQPSFGP